VKTLRLAHIEYAVDVREHLLGAYGDDPSSGLRERLLGREVG
jgi:hypothetical protein